MDKLIPTNASMAIYTSLASWIAAGSTKTGSDSPIGDIPSSKRLHSYGTPPSFIGKSTPGERFSIANGQSLPEGTIFWARATPGNVVLVVLVQVLPRCRRDVMGPKKDGEYTMGKYFDRIDRI